jgi:hypothetical protein
MTTKSEAMRRSEARRAMRDSADVIVIERREHVATIGQDPSGEHPMLRAAFMAASDYIANNADGRNPIALEWKHGPGTFVAAYTPEEIESD